ncbi:MAG: phosphoglucosamine mutase [Bryobacteraceae bacterium]|nr:phosphoglucosamine mutase [Bryobacteraceae bacterium]
MEPQVRKLFGTDGMRGVAGEPPLDRETVFAFGQALGRWSASHDSPQVLIGMDTRESGPWLAETLAGGLASEGAQPRFAGLITTPGVAWLTRTGPFAAGVMISASHNPFHDNGLKVFDHSGFKIPDSTEYGIELEIFERLARGVRPLPLALSADPGLDRQYLDFLVSTFPHRLDGLKLVLDCAHGAAVNLAPALFERLGAQVIAIGASPTGRNINDGCGALHVESLRERVLAENADAGFAFDGDADRCLAVSKSGRVLDGDATLLICARYLRSRNRLGADVVATVMSNLGFELALKNEGIGLTRAAVGDKYVLEEMIRLNAAIGGEQSGHVIFREYATTGDGLMTALRILEAKTESGRPLDDLVAGFDSYPQKLVNVRVKERRPLAELPGVQSEIRAAESQMNGQGRVLVRFSGTEPLARVMVEAANPEHVEHWSARIADAIRAELS